MIALPRQDGANADGSVIFTGAAAFFTLIFVGVTGTAGKHRHLEAVITNNEFRTCPGGRKQEQEQEK